MDWKNKTSCNFCLLNHRLSTTCYFVNSSELSEVRKEGVLVVVGPDGSKAEMADSFPYIAKAIFAFEEIDGIDVCFFGMHVQEFGSNCPPPNAR